MSVDGHDGAGSAAEGKRGISPRRNDLSWIENKQERKKCQPKTSQAQQQQTTELKDLDIAQDKKLEIQKFAAYRLIHELRQKDKETEQ